MTETTDEQLARFEAEHMRPNSITDSRRREQLKVLREFDEELDGPLGTMMARDVLSFMGRQIEDDELHPNTVRKHHGMIKAFEGWAYRAGLIDALRYSELKAVPNPRGSKAQSTPKPYKPHEIRDFFTQLADKYPLLPLSGPKSRRLVGYYEKRGKRDRFGRDIWRHARRLQFEAQVALALEEGLRRIEMFRVTLAQIDPDNSGVIVHTAKGEPGQKKEREVPYMAHARLVVRDWLDFRRTLPIEHTATWLRLDPFRPNPLDPMTLSQLSNSLSLIGDRWTWHRFRHTYATEQLRAGVPVEKLQILLGHGGIEQTLAYTKIVRSDVHEASEAAEPAFAQRLGLAA